MKRLLWTVLLTILLLSGCGAKEINEASIPIGWGIDYRNHQFMFSTQLAQPLPPEAGGGEGPQFSVLSATGKTTTEAGRNIMLSFPNTPLWSHTNLLLLGEGLATTDMALFMDFITRNRLFRENTSVVITHQATPEQIFKVTPLLVPYTATAIRDSLTNQESQLGVYTPMYLNELTDRFAVSGIDPVIPMVMIDKKDQQETIKLEGMAVFRQRKMVGILNEMESRGYRFMRPKMIQGGLFVIPSPTDEGKWITLEVSRSQAKITPKIQGNKIIMKIEIKGEGNFYEQGGSGDLLNPKGIKTLEALANQEIRKQIAMCIHRAQSLESDIFGWGRMIHSADPNLWKELEPDWNQTFPDVNSEVTVKFSIRRSNLTDKSFVFR
jgi:Ger(x)C family germination protein